MLCGGAWWSLFCIGAAVPVSLSWLAVLGEKPVISMLLVGYFDSCLAAWRPALPGLLLGACPPRPLVGGGGGGGTAEMTSVQLDEV